MPNPNNSILVQFRELTPAEDCFPSSVKQLFNLFESAIDLSALESLGSVNLGSTQPGPDDIDLPWIRRALNGEPVGLFQHFQGQYRNMSSQVGMQMEFHGTVDQIEVPWHPADGENGTEDRSAEFTTTRIIIEYRGFPV